MVNGATVDINVVEDVEEVVGGAVVVLALVVDVVLKVVIVADLVLVVKEGESSVQLLRNHKQ